MKFSILTLFPEVIKSYVNSSILKKAIDKEKIDVEIVDIRDFTLLKHNQVDDYQFGGGKGMVMMIEPIVNAIESVKSNNSKIILTSPQGKTFNQETAKVYSKIDHLIIVCGHYEGVDSRLEKFVDEEISVGDYVLTGGELAALSILDATSRMINGIIKEESMKNDSFYHKFLDHNVYTKPVDFRGYSVPKVLLSGHHKNIEEYRLKSQIKNTYLKRNDLFSKIELTNEEKKILEEIKKEG